MKKRLLALVMLIIPLFIFIFRIDVDASSYLSDKTEVAVDLEVSGAEALCQTDDGYIWIAQYSGLTRYDSKEFITYKEFNEDNKKYDIINVRKLEQHENHLYILTSNELFSYHDNKFYHIDLGLDNGNVSFNDLGINKEGTILYIATTKGLYIHNIIAGTTTLIEVTKNIEVTEVAVDLGKNTYYYTISEGLYNSSDKLIYKSIFILDINVYKDKILIGQTDGLKIYDLTKNQILDTTYGITDQVNRSIYSEKDKMIFVACESMGVYCIDEETGAVSLASNLKNKSQLVDLLVDYEGNLWISSHNVSASGVSIITKNALLNLLYDDQIWQDLAESPAKDRNVYAIKRYENTLYIVATYGLFLYDLTENKIINNNPIMDKINDYVMVNDIKGYYDFRDVEIFKDKIYFAAFGLGLVEYNPKTNDVNIYGDDFMKNEANIISKTNNPDLAYCISIRSLRAFDDFLALGYSKGLIKFDGTKIAVYNVGSNILYINKTADGKVLYDQTKGLYTINDEFTEIEEIPTEKEISGNRLKFLVDGNRIYYNLNSRFFYAEKVNGKYESKEIVLPYVKGSIVEIAKVKVKDKNNKESYKYVIASQNQIYITSSLADDNLIDGRLNEYELYDDTNGLEPIAANTSGYYDETSQKYYFQTINGIFVYDFNKETKADVVTKIAVSSVNIDGVNHYGNDIHVDKNDSRIVFNLSIFGFKPNKGYQVYYKLDGVDNDYIVSNGDNLSISYTNISGGEYAFHVYIIDENGLMSNQIDISLNKDKKMHEYVIFWILVGLLSALAIGLLNYWFFSRKIKKAKKQAQELKNITLESIEAIARTIDAKDAYTNGHSIRVGHYSKIIGEALGIEGDELENLYYIALLHDIGKIAIPDAILNKPERLNDDEYEIMKSHTTKGARILEGISTIPNIIEGAKYHHERYDGKGYPEGLKGEDIPYIARVICCADCFDTMATRRVYKEPYSKERILSEFEIGKSTHFDPEIAEVVIKLIKEGKLKALNQ